MGFGYCTLRVYVESHELGIIKTHFLKLQVIPAKVAAPEEPSLWGTARGPRRGAARA